ncbi:MAG: hypothetical protein V4722_09710 [Bacteroidota bacterium]
MKNMLKSPFRTIQVLMICSGTFLSNSVIAQVKDNIPGVTQLIRPQHTETVGSIMDRAQKDVVQMHDIPEKKYPKRSDLPQNPLAKPIRSFPELSTDIKGFQAPESTQAPQTPGTAFNGVTGPNETGSFPPDVMGAVGPTQYLLFVNGRLRSFNKTTGVADGVLNANPNTFFASVMTPVADTIVQCFTSDPRVRYDRFSGRWILLIIDVPCENAGCTSTGSNRILLAVSNTGVITGATVWTFSQFLGQAGFFADYPTLGIDKNALYIGANMFSNAGPFSGTNGYVINRAALLAGGAYTVTRFTGLLPGSSSAGPFTPQGVDNFDPAPTEGYFVGVDNATFGTLMIRRVSTPGGVPTISSNISVTVPTTRFPAKAPHLGNTGGTNGELDALDDRLFAAMMRGGHLWTSHSIKVANTGIASTAAGSRNGVRWYDITNLATTPAVTQSGTIFDTTTTNPIWFFNPTVMISGQGHAVFSLCNSGVNNRVNTATAGRLGTATLGTTQDVLMLTASSTAYNPAGDPGGSGGRRWGDYSYVSLDPQDDMTMWAVNQFCSGANVYGCQVTKLLAPPPATPASCSPSSVATGQASVAVTVTGTVVSGSGFYDPGANLPAPALAFNHITASIPGVVVNSITYNSPTSVTLNLNTVGATAGQKNITITNPDGQAASGINILTIGCPPGPIYVKATAGGANNGSSWTDAFTTLPAAISASCSGAQIWVAAGTYKPTATNNRDLSFALINGVTIYGGFPNTGTPTLAQRNPVSNVTTLSGEIGVAGISDNSYHVISNGAGLTNTAILDGFVISDGNANGASGLRNAGGGMLNQASGVSVTCSPRIVNCVFKNNTATGLGGAVYNEASSNSAARPFFINCTFQNNTTSGTGTGGAIYNLGTLFASTAPTFINSIFQNNSSAGAGGAVYNAATSAGITSPIFTNCSFRNNTAASGTVMYNNNASATCEPTVTNCIFYGNGGVNSFAQLNASSHTNATNCLLEPGIANYTNIAGNITTIASPFVLAGDLHLKDFSLAIDAGTTVGAPVRDIDSVVRSAVPDMGAYENVQACSGTDKIYYSDTVGTAHQWQVNTGSGYLDITNGALYSNVTTNKLTVINPAETTTGNKFRCRVTTPGGPVFSSEIILRFYNRWLGTANNNWQNIANWSCGVLPSQYTDVIVPSAKTIYPLNNVSGTIRRLQAENGSSITVKTGSSLVIVGKD